jgi:hypothetical protein
MASLTFRSQSQIAIVAPKIPFIGECTLNGPARMQPSLAPFAGPIPPPIRLVRRHADFAPAAFDPRPAFISTSKLCHNGVGRIPFGGRIEAIGKPPDQPLIQFAFRSGEIAAPIPIAAFTQ